MKALTSAPALALTLLLALPAAAEPLDDDRAASPAPAASKAKKRKRRHPVVSGFQVPIGKLRTEPLPQPSGHLHIYAVNQREEAEVDLYNPDGTFNDQALDQLNHLWRCKRTDTEKPINPHLFEILSLIQDHFGGKTIELVSGFRNQRHTTSFHFHGSASDVRIVGLSDRALHQFVSTLDTGNMGLGIYPRSGFIHVDVRPEPSYRWTDYSPPGSNERARKTKKRPPNT